MDEWGLSYDRANQLPDLAQLHKKEPKERPETTEKPTPEPKETPVELKETPVEPKETPVEPEGKSEE